MDEKLKEAFHKVYEGEQSCTPAEIFAKKADQEDLPQIANSFG